jgi:hypothetical protein
MFEAQASIRALTQLLSCKGQGHIRHERGYLQLKEGITTLLKVKRCTDTSLKRIPAGHAIVPWREPRNSHGEIHRLCTCAQGAALAYGVFSQQPNDSLSVVATPKTSYLV